MLSSPIARLHMTGGLLMFVLTVAPPAAQDLELNDQEYFDMPGLNVMVFHDYYPEGHQGGISIVQNGVRVATNGDLRLEPTPGQWQPIPKVGKRTVNRGRQLVSVPLSYPDPERDRKGFNPIVYPDLAFSYSVNVQAEGETVRVWVDLDKPLPKEWVGRVGFNLELFPGLLFGRTYSMDGHTGLFPRQLDSPLARNRQGDLEVAPMAVGHTLTVAPEVDSQRMTITASKGSLQLLDGRAHHNNGWFVVRTAVPEGSTSRAVEWVIAPHVVKDWRYEPVVQVSQVGYPPDWQKVAVIECDPRDTSPQRTELLRILPSGEMETVKSATATSWGRFVRYQYFTFDFSEVRKPGMYAVAYGKSHSDPFRIAADVFSEEVWQPTLEYFLPVQMCHMRVNDRYRVWHGLCHLDDALMAPPNTHHFDGYTQGPSTLTRYKGLEPVPGLNVGGWHDAGDFDLRIESQVGTVWTLALAYEAFNVRLDQTTVDESQRLVELHRPDGAPDILQQVEHGVLAILAGYRNLGRLYRGIICPTLRQYVMLGDASDMTDNRVYNPDLRPDEVKGEESGRRDDRWVFTEENPGREIQAAAGLAAAARVLQGYNDALSNECLKFAETLWEKNRGASGRTAGMKIEALSELILSTDRDGYKKELVDLLPEVDQSFGAAGWAMGRLRDRIPDQAFWNSVESSARKYLESVKQQESENPYGVPYRPQIWGDGWNVQRFGVHAYFLHEAWPELVSADHFSRALNFVLGSHPGENTASFASGVGAESVTVAYGFNRADWSYIPGGVVSGTAYIRPDLPELKRWPFFWQQTEYVMGGGASNYLLLVLAAQHETAAASQQ